MPTHHPRRHHHHHSDLRQQIVLHLSCVYKVPAIQTQIFMLSHRPFFS